MSTPSFRLDWIQSFKLCPLGGLLSLFPIPSDSDDFTMAFTADKLSPTGKTTLAACTHMLPI